MRVNYCTFLLVVLFFRQPFCQAAEVFQGPTMGTMYKVIYTPTANTPKLAVLKSKVEDLLVKINQSMSTYIPNSEISLFKKLKPYTPMAISNDFGIVSQKALEIASLSQGAFDPTIGPLLRAYNMGAGGDPLSQKMPSPEVLSQTRSLVGYEKIKLKKSPENSQWILEKIQEGVELDYSAIAKGYGVDVVYELLLANHVKSALVEIGGELRASEFKTDTGDMWIIGLEKPSLNIRDKLMTLPLAHKSIATSGNYRNFRMLDGKRIGHILNPKEGRYIESEVASISVLADTCMEADAWATALFSLSLKESMALALKHKLPVIYFVLKNETFEVEQNIYFKDYLSSLKVKAAS
jgi:thiamine biosynthesis lipoprotein